MFLLKLDYIYEIIYFMHLNDINILTYVENINNYANFISASLNIAFYECKQLELLL